MKRAHPAIMDRQDIDPTGDGVPGCSSLDRAWSGKVMAPILGRGGQATSSGIRSSSLSSTTNRLQRDNNPPGQPATRNLAPPTIQITRV